MRDYVDRIRAASGFGIKYIASENTGYTGGNVTGVRYAAGELLFILNPDTRLNENAIETLCSEFGKRKANVMVLVPKIMIRNSDLINSIGMRRIRSRENLYTNIGYLERDVGQYDQPRQVEAFDGPAFIFRTQLLRYTFLFDPRFFFGSETTDLAERIYKLGFQIWTCPLAVVRHELRGSVTSRKVNEVLSSITVRNALIHTLRNMGWAMFFWTFVVAICYRNILGRLITGYNRRTAFIYLSGVIRFIVDLRLFVRPPSVSPTN